MTQPKCAEPLIKVIKDEGARSLRRLSTNASGTLTAGGNLTCQNEERGPAIPHAENSFVQNHRQLRYFYASAK